MSSDPAHSLSKGLGLLRPRGPGQPPATPAGGSGRAQGKAGTGPPGPEVSGEDFWTADKEGGRAEVRGTLRGSRDAGFPGGLGAGTAAAAAPGPPPSAVTPRSGPSPRGGGGGGGAFPLCGPGAPGPAPGPLPPGCSLPVGGGGGGSGAPGSAGPLPLPARQLPDPPARPPAGRQRPAAAPAAPRRVTDFFLPGPAGLRPPPLH